jgi:hypothetical protein
MTVQHNVITDPDIHEPKGIAAATAGKVYVSDGASSGEWKYAPGKAHAELVISGGTTNHTLNATAGTYSTVNTSWTASGNEDHLTVDTTNGDIDLLFAGHYLVSVFMTFTTSAIAAGTEYSFDVGIDGTETGRPVTVTKHTNAAEKVHVSFTTIVDATANQVLSLEATGDATSAGEIITPVEAGMTALFLD